MKDSKFENIEDKELYDMLCGDKKNARSAFDELYQRHSQRIFTYCKKFLYNQTLAEDIFQEVFTKLYISSQNKVIITNVGGFLLTCARNLCYNELNRKKESRATDANLEFGYYDNAYENKDLSDVINLAIDSLPEHYRDVIILKENLDLSYAEIAKIKDQPLSTVRVNIFRAKEKLRDILSPYLNELKD